MPEGCGTRYTIEDRERAFSLWATGKSFPKIQEETGISQHTLSTWKRRYNWDERRAEYGERFRANANTEDIHNNTAILRDGIDKAAVQYAKDFLSGRRKIEDPQELLNLLRARQVIAQENTPSQEQQALDSEQEELNELFGPAFIEKVSELLGREREKTGREQTRSANPEPTPADPEQTDC